MKDSYFISKNAKISSHFISKNCSIYGPSTIGIDSIIDSSVIIGYPIRSKIKDITTKKKNFEGLEFFYDDSSSGSIIGSNSHIRSFTTIYESTELGDYVETGTNVIIRENVKIEGGSIVGSGTIIDGDVFIGKNTRIQSNNYIPPKITIGKNVFLGPGVRFANDIYPASSRLIGTDVKNGAIIGIAAIILPGIIIGENSVISAGAIVTKDVPDEAVVMGCPAKQVMTRTEYDRKKADYEK